jgi:hypothetical protein
MSKPWNTELMQEVYLKQELMMSFLVVMALSDR